MLRLVATVSLARDESDYGYDLDRHDRAALDVLDRLPDGVRVVVHLGRRRFVTTSAEMQLRRHQHRLDLEMHGDGDALTAWHAALFGEVSA